MGCSDENLSCEDQKLGDSQLWRRLLRKFGDCFRLAVDSTSYGTSVSGTQENVNDQVAYDVLPAAGVGKKNYITSILVTNESADTGTRVDIIEDGGNLLWTGYAGPNGGGFSCSFPTALKQTQNNKSIQVQCAANGALVHTSINGYTN